MKTVKSLIVLLLITGMAACSQAQDVPAAVKQAFNKKFSNATRVEWGKENATEYEAEFVLDGTPMSANFTADGTWKETETEMDPAELPEAVRQTLQRDFADVEVMGSARIENAEGTLYEVETASKADQDKEEGYEKNDTEESGSVDLIFNARGKLLKKISNGEEGD